MIGDQRGGMWPRPFDEAIRSYDAKGHPRNLDGKVPAWTAEDEANLRRRVERLAAKAKP